MEGGFLNRYIERKIVDRSPFETIDKPGVGWLVRLAAWIGREAKPDLKLGICGEHGGDPESIAFFHMAGLDYVSCSPYRVPIARVAAAQARDPHDAAGWPPPLACDNRARDDRDQSRADGFHERMAACRAGVAVAARRPLLPGAARRGPRPTRRMRTPFQRDRDRIVHSKAFRRLKHKTQVFISPEGDHYRTRLTHTLEAAGSRAPWRGRCALNEDLTEAIGLGHDLGHPPFGHIGEAVLDELPARALRRALPPQPPLAADVERLERDGAGLNLTEQVRDGILRHTGPELPATLEGRIVRVVDRVAYINHDIDDALRAGVIARRGPARATRSRRSGRPAPSASTRWCGTWSSAPPRRATSSRATTWGPRWSGCASSCSSASTSVPSAQQRARPDRADAAGAVRPLRREPAAGRSCPARPSRSGSWTGWPA